MRTPFACRKCGRELVKDVLNHGYDAYTGMRKPPSEVLRCPLYSKSNSHDQWFLQHNILFGDRWVDGSYEI